MAKKTVRIATFNALNLVLPNRKYYDKYYTQDAFDKKSEWIAAQLENMKADIVGFQEIFDKEALEIALRKSQRFANFHIAMSESRGASPAVALASRYPIEFSEVYAVFPTESVIDFEQGETTQAFTIPFTEFSRPVLRADVRIDANILVSFYVVHLKSKRPIFQGNEDRDNPAHLAKAQARSLMLRTAEAVAFRSILGNQMQHNQNPVVVLGDVNDSGGSVTTRMISGEPPHRRLDFEKKKKIWDVLLYHAKDIQARRSYSDVYYTHIHNGHYESLDHIMVSQELVGENPNRIGRIGYTKVFNDHLIDRTLTNDKPQSWQSDHGIVVAAIEFEVPD